MTYSGAWRKATISQPVVPLVQPIDREHLTPDDAGADSNYVDGTGGPYLPTYLIDGEYEQGNVPSLYVNRTPVFDPEFGVGDLPGVDYPEAREIAGAAHRMDFGADAARQYENPGRREGTYEVMRVQNVDEDGASPVTDQIRSDIGYGSPYDEGARANVRIQRWRDRPIDMHWWTEQMRPLPVRNAYNATDKPVVPDASQIVSPYPGNLVTDPMNWETPQERRTPRDWNEDLTVDGTEPDPLSGAVFGLGQWGL